MAGRAAIAVPGLMALAGLAAGCAAALPAARAHDPAAGPSVWIQNWGSGTVTPIDMATGRAGRPVRIAGVPASIAITPGGTAVYVTAGTHSVVPVDAAARQAGRAIRAPYAPGPMAVSPDGRTVYVAASGTIVPVSTVTGRTGKPIAVAGRGDSPGALAVTPDGGTLYAVDGQAVVPVDVAAGRAGPPIRTGGTSPSIVITPDGRTVYVLGALNTVIPISTAAGKAGKPIIVGPPGSGPSAMVITPDGRTLYVSDRGTGTVVPVSTATGRAGTPVRTGYEPGPLAVTPDGRTVYAVTAGAVVPISTADGRAGQPIAVPGFRPDAIAISPDGATAWIAGNKWRERRIKAIPGAFASTGYGFVLAVSTATNAPGGLIRVGMLANCLVAPPWRAGPARGPSACTP